VSDYYVRFLGQAAFEKLSGKLREEKQKIKAFVVKM
jgi:hypothetical protein